MVTVVIVEGAHKGINSNSSGPPFRRAIIPRVRYSINQSIINF